MTTHPNHVTAPAIDPTIATLLIEREKLRAELAAAREALRGMVNQFNSHNLLPADRAVCDVARAALDAAKEDKS